MLKLEGEADSEAKRSVVSFEQLQAQYQNKIEAYARLVESYKVAQCKLSEARLAIQEWQDRALFYEQRHKKLVSQLLEHLHEITDHQGANSPLDCSTSSKTKLRLALNRLTQSAVAATTDKDLATVVGQGNHEGNPKVTSDQFRSFFTLGARYNDEGDRVSEKLPAGHHSKHMDNTVCAPHPKSVNPPTSRAPMQSSDTPQVLIKKAVTMQKMGVGKSKDAAVSRTIATQSVQSTPFDSTVDKEDVQTRTIDYDTASLSQEPPDSKCPADAGLSDKVVCEKRTSSMQTAYCNDVDALGLRSSKRKKQVDSRGVERSTNDDDHELYFNGASNSKCRLERLLRERGINRPDHDELQNTATISAKYDDSTDSRHDYRVSERRLPTVNSRDISPQKASDYLVPISKRNELVTFVRNTDQTENANLLHVATMPGSGEGIQVPVLQNRCTAASSGRRPSQSRNDISPPKRHAIRSRTPPGLWETGMPDTQELNERQGLS